MTRIFVDGSAGTTGLQIHERLSRRRDLVVLPIDEALRKDPQERSRLMNESDVVFLCLPDAAAVEAFRERLAARAQADRSGTLLLLADGRVASGDLMRLMGLAREAGVTRVQIGERRE